MDHVIQIVSALAWPATVVAIIILLRREIRQATRRITAVTYKGFRADFHHGLAEVQRDVEALPSRDKISQTAEFKVLDESADFSNYDRLFRIADISPRAAIMEAWRDIEVTTKKVTDAYGISVGGRIAGVKAIQQLVKNGILPKGVISIYERLRRLRSRAAHAADFEIDPEEAEKYIEMSHQFYITLLLLLKAEKK